MAQKFKVGMRARDARSLLNRLATDDAFRARLERDPQGTLAASNVVLPDTVFRGQAQFTLPPKSTFQSMVNDLRLSPAGPAAAEVVFLAFFAFFRK